jgi:hypothetical protein
MSCMQTFKSCCFKFDLLREAKKINLGVNSMKHYLPKADTIHNRIYSFYLSKCGSNFELKFLGDVDTTHS